MKNLIIISFVGSFFTILCHAMDDTPLVLACWQSKKDLTKITREEIQKVSKVYNDKKTVEDYIANLKNGDIIFADKAKDGQLSCVRRVFDNQDSFYANCQTIKLDDSYYAMLKDIWIQAHPERAMDTSH